MYKWSVFTFTQNKSGGVAIKVDVKDTKQEAENLYYTNLSSYGNNSATRYCRVELHDMNGECVLCADRDNAQYEVEE